MTMVWLQEVELPLKHNTLQNRQENCSQYSQKHINQAMKPSEEAILAAYDVRPKSKQINQLSIAEALLAALHVTGRANGGWKLLMCLHGGKGGL